MRPVKNINFWRFKKKKKKTRAVIHIPRISFRFGEREREHIAMRQVDKQRFMLVAADCCITITFSLMKIFIRFLKYLIPFVEISLYQSCMPSCYPFGIWSHILKLFFFSSSFSFWSKFNFNCRYQMLELRKHAKRKFFNSLEFWCYNLILDKNQYLLN